MKKLKISSKGTKRVVCTFSLSESDLLALEKAQNRLEVAGRGVNLSETVRAGLHALFWLSEEDLRGVLEKVPRMKPGKEKKILS